MRPMFSFLMTWGILCFANDLQAATERGHLLVIGGGLRPDNQTVYSRLIQHAGGKQNARFVIFPTASQSPNAARQVKLALQRYGVSADRIDIIDLHITNADQQAFNPQIVSQVNSATAAYFTGGDQRRIVQSLVSKDGTERPVLKSLRELLARGGVIAGSSAGAAMQSQLMLCVSGLPDESLDEGMDALDFGLTTDTKRRGLQVSRGLGFFEHGIVDQHFHQYRGRLSRLSRAVIEQQTRFGFGIDENSAIDVDADGLLEMLGPGCLTVVDATDAKLQDGPLGCQISGLRISSLEEGDRFDTRKGTAIVALGKSVIAAGGEALKTNHVIPDIAGEGAVYYALTSGLADNTWRVQVGVTMKYNGHFAHGYQFTFSKTSTTQSFAGYVNGVWCYSVLGVRLDIEPISQHRRRPADDLPSDLPAGKARTVCEAVLFRGLLLANEQQRFRPDEPITRSDLATAITQTLHLEPERDTSLLPSFAELPREEPRYESLKQIFAEGLLEFQDSQELRPLDPIARHEAAAVLIKVAERYGTKPPAKEAALKIVIEDESEIPTKSQAAVRQALRWDLLKLDSKRIRPNAPLTRQETAEALYRIVGFPW